MSTSSNRPLSPHLFIYKPQLTSIMSIAHRITGVLLSMGSAVLAIWLISAALGGSSFEAVHGVVSAWYGLILMFGWSFALFYHLCNGIRHLFWDAGLGLDIETAYLSGYITVAAAALLTVVAWVVAIF
jgi:succinate dehydrogenase / fumarate reductase cytochrome b subunit